jgi:hypothetical protein
MGKGHWAAVARGKPAPPAPASAARRSWRPGAAVHPLSATVYPPTVAVYPLIAAVYPPKAAWRKRTAALSSMAASSFSAGSGTLGDSLPSERGSLLSGCDSLPSACDSLPSASTVREAPAAASLARGLLWDSATRPRFAALPLGRAAASWVHCLLLKIGV